MLGLASSVPAVLLSLVLVVSGIAKIRDSASVRESFVTLQLPPWLTRSAAPLLLPWAELVLAVALLALAGRLAVVVAGAVVALFVAYLVVILRAAGFDHPVECGCLGRLGLGVVGRVTVVRNAFLVLLAVWTLVDALGGNSVAVRWLAAEPAGWAWLAVVVMGVLLGGLMVYAGQRGTSDSAASAPFDTATPPPGAPATDDEDVGDYERTPIPHLPLTTPDGQTTTLRRLAGARARLLVFINPGCGSCLPALEAVPRIRKRAPQLGIHLVFLSGDDAQNPYVTPEALGDEWFTDPQGIFVDSLEIYSPAAVLLGADGYLAGGPVQGADGVREFFDDIAAALAAGEGPGDTADEWSVSG